MSTPELTHVHYRRDARELVLTFGNQPPFTLSAEYLRVHSPSAEVRGHGKGQEVLQTGKQDVGLLNITQTGHYALKLHFDDGHDSGLYTYDYLHELATHQADYWQQYLTRLEQAGESRQAPSIMIKQL
ncbi:gamma-butyrobetaine hydroxylase-like domain-containing protein [Larsenimonas rhizosphaerae]|uniref:DUF971 domain-containing protein n=1 Tax=Larsenimonas rhizosphaerae TaxID=2944682 RepID=A0AA41ZNS8_9GAMM|nr:DUF971 domain-containing protein [Larsenimonas rhizosphaerae]MCM2129696.1 DUF971 domain-containing protein [Larsenimonas rhizosphaerae]MCX2524355.1 DUF971 domain-containing protein [Larsenimonas rhizosphaerae]